MTTTDEISNIDKIAESVNAALGIFASAETILDGLQPVLVDLLTALQAVPSKKDVKENPDLIRLFERTYRGIDRSKLIAWFGQFSPIRVRIDQSSGRFDKIGWEKNGKWDVEGAKACDWWTAQGEAKSKSAKTGEIASARKAVAKVIARKLYAETNGTEIAELKDAIEKMKEGFWEGVLSDALDVIRAPSWEDWTDSWDARVAKETALDKEREANEKKKKEAKAKEIAAALNETKERGDNSPIEKPAEDGEAEKMVEQTPPRSNKGRRVGATSTATH